MENNTKAKKVAKRRRSKRTIERDKEISDYLMNSKSVDTESRADSEASDTRSSVDTPEPQPDAPEAILEPPAAVPVNAASDTETVRKEEPLVNERQHSEQDRLIAAQRRIILFLTGPKSPNHNENRTIKSIVDRSTRYLQSLDSRLL